MGICYGKNAESAHQQTRRNGLSARRSIEEDEEDTVIGEPKLPSSKPSNSPYRASPFRSPFRGASEASPANGTPSRMFKWPFPPPSPAKHIQVALLKRHGAAKPKEGTIPEDQELEKPLDRSFGYGKNFTAKYELGKEVGRGHFGHTCVAQGKKGDLRGQSVAVKVISKAKMTTAIAIEDVRREVKILKALTGHYNLVKFYDACEDDLNVYIVMELCEGGELLDRILARGGKYSEEDAKVVVAQILSIVAFCHLQGVVHRDLKPEVFSHTMATMGWTRNHDEILLLKLCNVVAWFAVLVLLCKLCFLSFFFQNFLFTTNAENAELKAIDFGLSDFVRPDGRLNDIVGSAYYVAPEVLHRSYSIEADVWSIGVITYILLCGSRPFWARTESGIFKSVLKSDPTFNEAPWPSVSEEAKDFVKRLLIKDRHRRMTAVQALTHPWIRGHQKVPLDVLIFRLVKSYLRSSVVRRSALKALSKTLSEDHLFYLRAQFMLLEPSKNGRISLENFKSVLTKHATEAMKDSRMFEMIQSIDALQFKKLDFQEFCAAATSVLQLEGLERWDQQARNAYQIFEKEGNRVVLIEDLARELGIPSTVPAHVVLHEWVRHNDGRLSFFGFTNLLRGMPPRAKQQQPSA